MKKFGLFILALVLLAAPLAAQTIELDITYTSTTAGGVTTLTLAFPNADAVLIRDAFADWAGWTATVECTQAMVTAGQCLTSELGTQVTNPQTVNQASKGAFEELLVRLVQRNESKKWEAGLAPKPEVTKKP